MEGLEQLRLLRLGDPDAGVAHPADNPAGLAADREPDLAVTRELARVAQQVEQGLLQLGLIGHDMTGVRCALDHQRVAVGCRERLDHQLDLVGQRPQPDRLDEQLHLPGLNLGKIQHVVDQGEQVLARPLDLRQVRDHRLVAGVFRVLAQDLAVTDDRVERRTELVAHVRHELALDFVGLLGVLACPFQFELAAPYGRHVGKHLDRDVVLGPALQHRDDALAQPRLERLIQRPAHRQPPRQPRLGWHAAEIDQTEFDRAAQELLEGDAGLDFVLEAGMESREHRIADEQTVLRIE